MCFGSKSSPPPTPAPPMPGVVSVSKVAPDPAGAPAFRGRIPDGNYTGRNGGELTLEAADNKAAKTALGQ